MIAAPDLGEYYTIDCAPGAEAPQYLWMAIARPTRPGLPTYAVNQRGQVVLVPDGAIELNPTAELPSHAEPVQ